MGWSSPDSDKRAGFVFVILTFLTAFPLLSGCFDLSLPERPDAGTGGSGDTGVADSGNTQDTGTQEGGGAGKKPDGESCKSFKECEHGACTNDVCCAKDGACCSRDDHCAGGDQHLSCDTSTYQCFEQCASDSDEDLDEQCAQGYHCDANQCFEDIAQGDCDENSDCVSGECVNQQCCQHAGLCCAEDGECPEMFDGCATDGSQTCVFSFFSLPDTGQTQCFDVSNKAVTCGTIGSGLDYHGQDGHYSGEKRSYSDLGDGTVRDNVTGLLWTKASGDSMSFTAAEDYCGSLALAGHAWLLPRRFQLQTLVNYGSDATVGIDAAFDLPDSAEAVWTSTPLAGAESSTAWTVDFKTGTVSRTGKDNPMPRVLCVAEEG